MKFAQFCQWLANHAGKPSTFLIAVVLIAMWAASGPWFHFNDTWQLIVNTSTTIITFLMVFLIQNTQNRDNDIIHVKLDELIRATKSAEHSVLISKRSITGKFINFARNTRRWAANVIPTIGRLLSISRTMLLGITCSARGLVGRTAGELNVHLKGEAPGQ